MASPLAVVALAVSLLVAAATTDPPLVVTAAALAVAIVRRDASRPAVLRSWRPAPRFFVLLLLSGLCLELSAWLGSYLLREAQPKLMHPQLLPDLALAIGFYGGLAAAWALLARRFSFSRKETALLYGISGILLEQQGAVLPAAVRYFAAAPGPVVWMVARVGIVYGTVGLLASSLAYPDLPAGSRRGALRFAAAVALPIVGAYAGTAVIAVGATALGGFPPRRLIFEHPFL
jgi:hypothetical protein